MSRVSLSYRSRGADKSFRALHVEVQEQGSLGIGNEEALLFECVRVLKTSHALQNLLSASFDVVALFR